MKYSEIINRCIAHLKLTPEQVENLYKEYLEENREQIEADRRRVSEFARAMAERMDKATLEAFLGKPK